MNRNKQMLTAMTFMIFTILIIFIGTDMNKALENNNLIRLHVIANSDSSEDQALKYKVRDQLLLSFGETFRYAQTIDEARDIIKFNLNDITEIASREIKRQGFDYQAEASLGISSFPTKVYGDLVYPAGDYEALRVVIGEGSGANWWCVMFPPLCFVDVSSGVISESEADALKETVVIAEADSEGKKVVYTFKLAQWWNSFRNWINDLFK